MPDVSVLQVSASNCERLLLFFGNIVSVHAEFLHSLVSVLRH